MNLTDTRRASDELARALASGNPETIARSAALNVWPLYNDHPELLAATIAELPSRVLQRYPMLCVLHPMTTALAHTASQLVPAEQSIEAALQSPEETDFLYLAQMLTCRLNGDVETALIAAGRLQQRIHQQHVESLHRMDGPLWYFHQQIGSTLLAAGDSGAALVEFETARVLGMLSRQNDAERMALGGVALAHAVRGAHDEALRALAEARRLPMPALPHRNSITSSETAAAALLAVDQVVDDAEAELEADLAAMESFDSLEPSWPFALLARCRAFLVREQAEHALEALHLAAEAHTTQPRSFAADVIGSMSIQVLLSTGDLIRARRLADQPANDGILMRLAVARLSVQDGRFDVTEHELLLLDSDDRVGPAQLAESAILAGWLEFCRTGEMTPETVERFSHAARRADGRRHMTGMPRQLLDQVSAGLPLALATRFDLDRAGLTTIDMVARPHLTTGELRILNALPGEASIADIASAFGRSPNTVKSQLRTIYRKLGCSTRDDAIRLAMRLRLLGAEVGS